MQHWQFLNSYSLGKHLSEQLVAQRAQAGHFPAAIVRPSFVVGVAAGPYPGYVGNLAGPGGFGLAFGLGFLQVTARARSGQGGEGGGEAAGTAVLEVAGWLAGGLAGPPPLLLLLLLLPLGP
jgi:fatty acyl-CoA reductase